MTHKYLSGLLTSKLGQSSGEQSELVELDSSGNKLRSYVYGAGTRLARHELIQGSWQVRWYVGRPVTNDWGETISNGNFVDSTFLDPLGADTPPNDPYLLDPTPTYIESRPNEPLYIDGGDPFDLSGGCTRDGLPISCNEAYRLAKSGSVTDSSGADVIALVGGTILYGLFGEKYVNGDYAGDVLVDIGSLLLPLAQQRRRQSGQQQSQTPAQQKNCATPNSLINDPENRKLFEALWDRTMQSGEENGAAIFYERATNTYHKIRLSEGRHDPVDNIPAMPSAKKEMEMASDKFAAENRDVFFMAYFHTHPNYADGTSASGKPSGFLGDITVQASLNSPLGIIRAGNGYHFFMGVSDFQSDDSRADKCIWELVQEQRQYERRRMR